MSIDIKIFNPDEEDLSGRHVQQVNSLLQELSGKAQKRTKQEIAEVADSSLLFLCHDESSLGDTYNSDIVGMATLVPAYTLMGDVGHIEDVVVASSQRGKGLGEALLETMIIQARRMGLVSLHLTSKPEREAANRLYQKLGFARRETNVYRLTL